MSHVPPATAAEIAQPAAPGERHAQALKIACSLAGNGLATEAIFVQLRSMYAEDVTDAELQGIVEWAARQNFTPSRDGSLPPVKFRRRHPARPITPDPTNAVAAVEAFLAGYRCTDAEVMADSPVKPEHTATGHATTILRELFQPGDLVNVVVDYVEAKSSSGKPKYNPKGYGNTKTAAEWITAITGGDLPTGLAGVWLRMNPLNGKPPKRFPESKIIGVDDENVSAHRFALIEFDEIPTELQLAFLRRLPLPVAAIISSGGRSVHAWIVVNATTEVEYDSIVTELLALLKPFGADQSNKNPSRLSRLPGAVRRLGGCGDGGQRMLFCDASALKGGPLDLTALREAVKPWRAQSAVASASMTLTTDATDDICVKIIAILSDTRRTSVERHEAIAKAVVAELQRRGRFYFHAAYRDYATAMHFDSTTKRLLRVQADEFLSGVATLTGINRGNPVFRYIQAAVEDVALIQGVGIIPESFWASRGGAMYLSNGDGAVAKVTGHGVNMLDNGTDGVLFAVGATLRPWELTSPEDPFATCSLFRDANYADGHGKTLLKLWMLSLPTNPNCKPPLATAGLIRSGKTRTVRGICELYGLPFAAKEPNRTERSETDFWVAMDGGGLFCLDNCDSKVDWLPDAVAAASTGVGDVRRQLYTDRATMELKPRAWLALTSANPTFAADVGMADRLLAVRLHQRTGETNDEALSVEIANHRNAGLSWIAHTLAAALADAEKVTGGLNKRHPDFATFAVRLGRALDCEDEAVAALMAAEQDKSRLCLENDAVGAALLALMENDVDCIGFQGTAADLLARYDDQLRIVGGLAKYDPDFSPTSKGNTGKPLWSAKRLGKRLAALWIHIEALFEASRHGDEHGHATVFSIKPRVVRFERFHSTIPEKSLASTLAGSFPESLTQTAETATKATPPAVGGSEPTTCATCGSHTNDCDCWIAGLSGGAPWSPYCRQAAQLCLADPQSGG